MGIRLNYTALGLFVVLLGSGLIYAVYWFSDEQENKIYHPYLVYVGESVAGLTEGSSVKYNGVDVGAVKKIEISRVNFKQVEILLNVVEGTPITKDTYATIVTHGVTGISYIGLKTIVSAGKPLQARSGELYPVIQNSPSLFVELDEAVSTVTENIKILVKKIELLLDDENQKYVKSILRNVDKITKVVSDKSTSIESSIDLFESALLRLDDFGKTLPEILANVDRAVDTFQTMSNIITNSSGKFNDTMDVTKQLVSSVNNQIVPEMDKTLYEMEQLLNSINVLMADIQKNPSLLVRGKSIDNYGPGEKK